MGRQVKELANAQNLVPNEERTIEERRANARKAGKASGEARRRKRTFKQVFSSLLPQSVDLEGTEEIAALAQDMGEITAQDAMAMALICKAMKGDIAAFTAIRDTIGENPSQKVEGSMDSRVTLSLSEELKDFAQ